MDYHLLDSEDEEQVDNMQAGEEENELVLNGEFEPISSSLDLSNSLDTSDEDEQIDNMHTRQKENELVLNDQFKPIASGSKSMKYPFLDSSDEDEPIDNIMQYSMDTSDEYEQVEHMQTGKNDNAMVLGGQFEQGFEPIVSSSKSIEYHLSDISDDDEQMDNIFMGSKGNETVILNELDEKFIINDLPGGWIKVNHDSGMPVYFNKDARVCSFTKPYSLGAHSLKNHHIPVENVPCLGYKLKLENINSQKGDGQLEDCKKKITPEEYRAYCNKLFKFKDIKFMRFSSWDKRREYIRMIKADRRRKDLPKFKDKSKLITVPVDPPVIENPIENTALTERDEWIINLNNKSYVSILHEYLQRVLKTQPSYVFKELENARYPYLATVVLDKMHYGTGIGSSKKQAKLDSARATLDILLPSAKNQIENNAKHTIIENQVGNVFVGDIVFDKLKIKDTRIPEFCAQAAETMPYDMLQLCVERNFGEQVKVKTDMTKMQCSNDSEIFYSLTMQVNKHSATVICQNKRDGRQKGAQALLKVLHPHVKYFGSLLRLYSHPNVGGCSEKKLDEPGTQSPQPRGCANQDILNKLKKSMTKLEQRLRQQTDKSH